MTIRWVVVHLLELPNDSRIKKHYGGDKAILSINDHLVADVRDLLLVNQYFAAVGALKDLKKSEQQKVIRGMPKRPERPGDDEGKNVPLATPEQLKMLFPTNKERLRRRQQRKQQMTHRQ